MDLLDALAVGCPDRLVVGVWLDAERVVRGQVGGRGAGIGFPSGVRPSSRPSHPAGSVPGALAAAGWLPGLSRAGAGTRAVATPTRLAIDSCPATTGVGTGPALDAAVHPGGHAAAELVVHQRGRYGESERDGQGHRRARDGDDRQHDGEGREDSGDPRDEPLVVHANP